MLNLLLSAVMQVFTLSLVPFIWWAITNRKENFFYWLGFRKPVFETPLIKAFLQTIFVAVVYIMVMVFIMITYLSDVESATSQFAGKGMAAVPSVIIYAIIQTSLSEEIFFRGFLCKRLSNKFGFIIGNSIQALCFGLLHGIPYFMATGNVFVLVLVTILPGLIGFYQGYLNEKVANGSIIPSWILHALMNITSGIAASL